MKVNVQLTFNINTVLVHGFIKLVQRRFEWVNVGWTECNEVQQIHLFYISNTSSFYAGILGTGGETGVRYGSPAGID